MADANNNRSSEIFQDVFYSLLAQCQELAPKHKFKFKNPLYSFDSSLFTLCLSLFSWAKYRKKKGPFKLHTLLDHSGYLPSFLVISEGKTHDINVVKDDTYGFPDLAPDSIILEVQDYTVHLAYDQVKQMIDRLKPLGYQFSIDHFGAGTTAFSYLHSLDIDFLKVDRCFVRDLHSNTDNQFFIRSVAQIAHNRDILLIAEGVEKEAELNALSDLNVDGAMGYLLGEPKDRGQFT